MSSETDTAVEQVAEAVAEAPAAPSVAAPAVEAPDAAAPGEPTKVCEDCGHARPFNKTWWPHNGTRPSGVRCRRCKEIRDTKLEKARALEKRAIAARTGGKVGKIKTPTVLGTFSPEAAAIVASLTKPKPPAPAAPAPKAAKSASRAEKPIKDAAEVRKVLASGAGMVNANAEALMEMLMAYAMDPTSPMHEYCFRLLAERIVPKKLYESIGQRAMGLDNTGREHVKTVTINVRELGAPEQQTQPQPEEAQDASPEPKPTLEDLL